MDYVTIDPVSNTGNTQRHLPSSSPPITPSKEGDWSLSKFLVGSHISTSREEPRGMGGRVKGTSEPHLRGGGDQ